MDENPSCVVDFIYIEMFNNKPEDVSCSRNTCIPNYPS